VTSARRLYRLQLVLALAGATVTVLAVAVTLQAVSLKAPPGDPVVKACMSFALPTITPLSIAVLLLTSLSLAVAALTARSLIAQLAAQRRVLRALQPTTAGRCGDAPVRWFDDDQPRAFCAGLLRPRIYLSREAAHSLSVDELNAVIAHEQHHVLSRDPLRLLVARAVADGLFFLPLLKRLTERYAALAELAADDAAVRRGGSSQPLAAALLAFEAQPGSQVVGIAPERVDHLLGQPARWRLPAALLMGALVALLGVMALSARAAEASAHSSLSLPLLGAQLCMVAMVVVPPALGASALLMWRRARSRA